MLKGVIKDRRGQSFIEAMVALTIIITSVSSALALVQSSLTSSSVGGTQIVASNLAREGVEIVRSIRDSNWLAGGSFKDGLTYGTDKTAIPVLDKASGSWSLTLAPLAMTDALAALYLDTDGGYVHAGSMVPGTSATPYRRLLTVNYICRENSTGAETIVTVPNASCPPSTTHTFVGLEVQSAVRWTVAGGSSRNLTVTERLYDWR